VLAQLEDTERKNPAASLIDDLPLFAVSARRAPDPAGTGSPLMEVLSAVNPDEMTPREAMEALYKLKSIAREG
jgi:DNA mismatch repair protein MutS